MGFKTNVLNFGTSLLKTGVEITAGSRAKEVFAHLAERLTPVLEQDAGAGKKLKFYCPSYAPVMRAKTLLTKEPETLAWIDSFNKGDVFWDVGANVGVYSLYAALRGHTVYSFEPAPGNYYLLSRNVEINGFSERMSSFCLAFNDESRVDTFYMSTTELGGACSSFGEAIDFKGETYSAEFKQSMLGFTIDGFIQQFGPVFPTHLKIDVDGIEKKILKGAPRTLEDPRLKSVLIELNTDLAECAEIIEMMAAHGYTLFKKEHAEAFYTGQMAGIYNHIFVKKAQA
jgi:FkbM family methyltransferase